MADTLAELPPPGGRVYVCVTCIDELSRLRGGLSPVETDEVHSLIQELQTTIADLEQLVALERANKVVSVAELQEMWEAKPQVAALVAQHDPEPKPSPGRQRRRRPAS